MAIDARWQFLALAIPAGTGFGHHDHDEHQLVLVDDGVVGLATATSTWAIPAGCGVWLPATVGHEVLGVVDGHARFGYLRAPDGWVPPPPGAVALSPLARAAVAVLSDPGARRGAPRRRLEAVLLDEVERFDPVPLLVALPQDPAARHVAELVLTDPADDRGLDALAADAGASPRTLQRRFPDETGLSFRAWRRRARLQQAMAHLDAGETVTATAYATGFSTPSAFVNAFRDELGITPAVWARRAGGDGLNPGDGSA